MKRIAETFKIGALVLCFFVFISAGFSLAAANEDRYGGVLKEVLTVGPATPIGFPSEAAPDARAAARPALETLVKVTQDGRVEPLLAESWEIAPDRKSITFKLQKGVRFHDGTTFNAQAVKWNFNNAIKSKRVPGLKSVEVLDDYTVRTYLDKYTNVIFTSIQDGCCAIISPSAAEKNGLDWVRWHPVGTGPFKFVAYERDAKLTYEKNKDYWRKGLPYLDGVEFVVIADDSVQKMAFQRGDIHRLQAKPLTALELKNAGFPYYAMPFGSFVLIPDSKNSDSPLANKKVRLAISHALDREALAEGLGHGFANPAYQVFPGIFGGALPNLQKHEYNPEKAKKLLAEAGYPNGLETNIWSFIRIVPRDYINAVANMLQQVGIKVNVGFPEAGKYSEYRFKGWKNGMLGHALAPIPSINRAFNMYFGGIQFPSLQKPARWEEVFNAAMDSLEIDYNKTRDLIQLVHDDVMVIPYMEETQICFYQKGVNIPEMEKFGTLSYFRGESWLAPDLR
jgi:peptide/nickel transport system substrate-binding protein